MSPLLLNGALKVDPLSWIKSVDCRYQQLTYLVGTMRKPTISCYTGEVRLYTISMCRCCPHVQMPVLLERY
jgi:hypothetical protein